MKKEVVKETGKLLVDLSKIIFAVVLVTPFIKDGSANAISALVSGAVALCGLYLINKGAEK